MVQTAFIDNPARAVADADRLVALVMRERGYPVEDFGSRAADISVDHPDVVENYRSAHNIHLAQERADVDGAPAGGVRPLSRAVRQAAHHRSAPHR